MAINDWSVTYTSARPFPGSDDTVPVRGKLMNSLAAAMNEEPVTDWVFEVRGQVVDGIAEFQRLVDEAGSASPGEFIARTNSVVIASN
ncbi:hypothetical protein [Streptomyces sp.]|uniref:hypothetical protein n=1 Tax=Streptomyces sp. TaxID=1931 RepID=UPI002D77FEFA|nr:hypothetical protein [Streptomyces sp.]HET6354613.1 hypothetical protein [Streptomyces sp.]